MGLHVAAVDFGQQKMALARTLGAETTSDASPVKSSLPLGKNGRSVLVKPLTKRYSSFRSEIPDIQFGSQIFSASDSLGNWLGRLALTKSQCYLTRLLGNKADSQPTQ